jgi:hypothetical protein
MIPVDVRVGDKDPSARSFEFEHGDDGNVVPRHDSVEHIIGPHILLLYSYPSEFDDLGLDETEPVISISKLMTPKRNHSLVFLPEDTAPIHLGLFFR